MRQSIDATAFMAQVKVSKKGEDFSIPVVDGVFRCTVRCPENVGVFGIDRDGQAIFLADGKVIELHLQLFGFTAIQFSSVSPFVYSATLVPAGQDVDPIPVVIEDTMSDQDYQRIAMMDALREVLRKEGVLQTGVDLDGLIEDLEDELEFGDDDDDFGEGYMEQLGLEPNEGDPPPEGPSAESAAPSGDEVPPSEAPAA